MPRSRRALEQAVKENTPRSLDQWERGLQTMPGGVIKGAYFSKPHPVYMDKAEECYLWDIDGNKYLDFTNHHTAMILGHSPPSVVQAITDAISQGLGFGAPSTLEAEVSEEIVGRFQSIDKVRFTASGTESSLHATRLARAFTSRPKVAKFEGAYHGSHDALEISVAPNLSLAGPPESPKAVAAWPGMSPSAEEETIILPYGQRESVELILREHKDEIGGVFFDAKAGIYDIDPDFVHFLRDITSELGMIMIMDEIVSFRAGYSGYQGLVGVDPDLTLFAKIMTGGMPGGVIAGKSEFMDLFDNSGSLTLNQSGTFSGNHITLAAGLATLRGLTPEVYSHFDSLREQLITGIDRIFSVLKIDGIVKGLGSIVNFDLSNTSVTDYRSMASTDKEPLDLLRMEMMLRGHLIAPGMGLCLSAPMQPEHIDEFLEALEKALETS
ncbi:MAG: aminotransferase class III-fold pyridoxal phosphate-dependent enzyme [Chloroflexota bacterium]|nr:aminotransferase class III-fold pyridoxal phosphate-dependent enzyme [Chloroflexota bacterium]